MTRKFLTVTQDEVDKKLAENIRSRELELVSYDFERDGHHKAIISLGDIAWDESTIEYKGLSRDAMVVRALENGLSTEEVGKIADLLALDSHKLNLHAVAIETGKSERHYKAALEALPEGKRREVAIASLTEKSGK